MATLKERLEDLADSFAITRGDSAGDAKKKAAAKAKAQAEARRKERAKKKAKEMKRPESGGKPKRIEGRGEPGGPHTPGAKRKRRESR